MASAAWFSTAVTAEAPVSPTAMGGLLGKAAPGALLRDPSTAARAECGLAGGLRSEAEGGRGAIGRANGEFRWRWSSICTCIGICKGCGSGFRQEHKICSRRNEGKKEKESGFFPLRIFGPTVFCFIHFLFFLPFTFIPKYKPF
jgi:hypothetical protein